MTTLEDLRKPGTASGFRHVSPKSDGSSKWYALIRAGWRRGKGVYLGLFATPKEAAQAVCDYLNGHTRAPAPQRPIDLTPVERKRAAPSPRGHKEGFPDRFKKAIKERDGHCVGGGRYWADCDGSYPLEYCQVDHIDPDGNHSMENGQTLCQNCHGVKCAEEKRAQSALDWSAA